ncbi:MAG: hypothetical protein ACKO23_18130 [Gemmataceae bacterium]
MRSKDLFPVVAIHALQAKLARNLGLDNAEQATAKTFQQMEILAKNGFARLSPADLRQDVAFAWLADDPRFQEIWKTKSP